ncbi:MAG TPA: cell division protein FtsZ [Patescibacteria group bacterium]|nr:cell division protein FtsZ [Patescibacteria group bacterium]
MKVTTFRSQATEVKPAIETFAKIKVVGVGGAGGEAVNRMMGSKIRGVDFIVVNTDAQALHHSKAPTKIHVGKTTTKGLGSGMDPEMGRKAAEENQEELHEFLKGADMVFVTCGLGGGTGTGAGPIVAEIARDLGALTIGVVTKPFEFEGAQRRNIAERGLRDFEERVDALITIPNDRILQVIDKKTSLLDAFAVVDQILQQGVQGISDVITTPGIINVDFADVKAIMSGTGSALMGIGIASGENRAVEAAKAAIESPLLELSVEGAKGILFTIAGGKDLGMHEVNEAAKIITASASPDARIIFGAIVDEALADDEMKVTVIATGFGSEGTRAAPAQRNVRPMTLQRDEPGKGEGNLWQKPARKIYVEPEEARERAPERVRSAQNSPNSPAEKATGQAGQEDEDLEIPAFIRKKMM